MPASAQGVSSTEVSAVEVGEAYLDLHHRVHRTLDRAMCAAGLSLTHAKVLLKLKKFGSMNQARLAGVLNLAPRSVTDIVDALEHDGLVTRCADSDDRRARVVCLTAAGEKAYEAALAVRDKAMEEIFGSLSTTERSRLVGLLSTIRTTLETGESSCDK